MNPLLLSILLTDFKKRQGIKPVDCLQHREGAETQAVIKCGTLH